MLQRGRAHVSAESFHHGVRLVETHLLQRGRAHVSAESRRGERRHCFGIVASTGPRSRERGEKLIHFVIDLKDYSFNGAALT